METSIEVVKNRRWGEKSGDNFVMVVVCEVCLQGLKDVLQELWGSFCMVTKILSSSFMCECLLRHELGNLLFEVAIGFSSRFATLDRVGVHVAPGTCLRSMEEALFPSCCHECHPTVLRSHSIDSCACRTSRLLHEASGR